MLALVVMVVLVIAPGIHSADCDVNELCYKYNYQKRNKAVEYAQIGSIQGFGCKDNHAMKHHKSMKEAAYFDIQCIKDPTNAAKAKWDLDTPKLTECKPICLFLDDPTLGNTTDGKGFVFEADTEHDTIRCSTGYYWPDTNADEVTDLTCKNGVLTSNGKLVKCERNNICTNTTANAASAASAGVDVPATDLTSDKYPCKSGYQNKLGQNKTELEMTCFKNVLSPTIPEHACVADTPASEPPVSTEAPDDDDLWREILFAVLFTIPSALVLIGSIVFVIFLCKDGFAVPEYLPEEREDLWGKEMKKKLEELDKKEHYQDDWEGPEDTKKDDEDEVVNMWE